MTVAATGELLCFIGVARGVGFSTYPGLSFEYTPMHHRREGALPGLHTLRIH
jgi:hypothetical protein